MLKTVGFPSTRTGDQTIVDGNLVIGTSGKGIDFSATPGTGTSELLNDYEEGVWTPGIGTLTQVGGSFSSYGTYTKVGRQVTVVGRIDISGGTIAGTALSRLTGLPFTVVAPTSIGAGTNSSYTTTFAFAPEATETNAYVTAFAATSGIKFTATYFV